jgi:fatty-acyl-CoA synthase
MLSLARGRDAPLLEVTIDEKLQETVRRIPQREAIVACHQGVRLTFAELNDRIQETARGLAGLGLSAGDRVGIWSTNCVEWILVQLASARLGLILVNVNPAYRSHELTYILRKSKMKALFVGRKDARADYRRILEEASAEQQLPLQRVIYFGEDSWQQMIASGSDFVSSTLSCQDVVSIQYTSGTTGWPKGVLLTHRNVLNNASLGARCMNVSERDRICVPVPMYHCFGCVAGTMMMLTTGATVILPAPQFDALATLQAVAAERATVIYGVPTMFIAELNHPEFSRFDLGTLRTGIMAGAPCPLELMRRVTTEMHCAEMTIAYGQTESSPIITMSSTGDSLETRVSTVGGTLPMTEVKLVSVAGETVPVGQEGELCTRGYLVMTGYDDEPEATAQAIDSAGWLHTGDLAIMQSDGCFCITGRARDMIIRGGENIYPREIEEFLYTHPKISEAQVVGLPDAIHGQVVCAWIRLKNGETSCADEIREFCKGKIAYFKIPEHVRFVDSFPMTVTGKVQKYKIREFELREPEPGRRGQSSQAAEK